MNKKTYKKWKNLTDKMLVDTHNFRNLCDTSFDRGFVGELLVIKQLLETYEKELCSSPENNLIYIRGVKKNWDIEMKLNGKSVLLNAKSTTVFEKHKPEPKWIRQNIKTYCNVTNDKKSRQHVSKKTTHVRNLFYVFVDVRTWLINHKTNYYVLSDKRAQSKFEKIYFKHHNRKKRIKNPKSTDFVVKYKDIKNFKDERIKSIKSLLS